MPDDNMPANHLAGESSPYLLQHAHNPVDWYPWGKEAFERARRENKPVFLSIGYSTCHWCHVMAHESFEDEGVARLLNGAFVCIKVDREERPDIDQLYMSAAQLMIRSAGWPLTIIMTPDKRPFFAATYIPRESRGGMTGLVDILPRISEMWETQKDLIDGTAQKVSAILQADRSSPGDRLGAAALGACADELSSRYDAENGGFGTSPKFPSLHTVLFLLWRHKRTKDPHALRMATHTLDSMRQGGIYDHVGGGFHRYATDSAWLVPHFEKMLYDQAMAVLAYAEAYAATGSESYLSTALDTARYVLEVLLAPDGTFYAAEDADSAEGEGAFYTWTAQELASLLGDALWPVARDLFGIVPEGNYFDEAEGGTTGRNILHEARPLGDVADMHGLDRDSCADIVHDIMAALVRTRGARERPHRDEKVLTDWNGLMVAALSRLAVASGEQWPLDAALTCAKALLGRMDGEGMVYHTSIGERGHIPGTLDDYAFLSWGLLELYEASFDTRFLGQATRVITYLFEHFWDKGAGGFFLSSDRETDLIARQKVVYDGAVPSGNSVMLLVLARGAGLLGLEGHEGAVDALMSSFSTSVMAAPSAHACFLMGADLALGPSAQVAVVGNDAAAAEKLVSTFRSYYAPHAAIAAGPASGFVPPLLADRPPQDGAQAYVCVGHTCRQPTGEPQKLAELLGELYKKQESDNDNGAHAPNTEE